MAVRPVLTRLMDCLAKVSNLGAEAHRKFAEDFADLHDGVWVVHLHHERFSLEVDYRAPCRLTLRVAEANQWVNLRLCVQGNVLESREGAAMVVRLFNKGMKPNNTRKNVGRITKVYFRGIPADRTTTCIF